MNMTQTKAKDDLDSLIELTVKANAETAHIVLGAFPEHPNVTTVQSIYNGVRPSHEVLSDLYKWAETFDPMVVRKIDELSTIPERG